MKPGLKTERPRRASIATVRDRPQVAKKVRNLQQPRRVQVEGNWDDLLKHAVAQAVKTAQDLTFRESDRMRDLVDRIGQIYEQRDPQYFRNQGMTRADWVRSQLENPVQLGHTLKYFGRTSGVPMFEQMGAQIVGYGPGAEYGIGATRRDFSRQQLTQPDQPLGLATEGQVQDRLLSSSAGRSGRRALQQTQIDQAERQGQTLTFLDAAGDVVDLAVPHPVVSMIGRYGPQALGAWITGRPLTQEFEVDRPELSPYFPVAQATLDYLEDREAIAQAQQGGADGRRIEDLYDQLRQSQRAMRDVARQVQVPDPYQAPDTGLLRDTAAALGSQVSRAVTPTAYPVFEAFGRMSQDMEQALLDEQATLSPDSPQIQGRYLTQSVGPFETGTRVTPEVQQRLQQLQPGWVTTTSPRGLELLESNVLSRAGQTAAGDPVRTGTRGLQLAMDVLGAHESRRALSDIVTSGGRLVEGRAPRWARVAVQAARKQLAEDTLAQRAWRSKAGQTALQASKAAGAFGARQLARGGQVLSRVPGVQRVARAARAAGQAGEGALARLFGRSAPAAQRLSRLAQLRSGLQGLGRGSVLFEGAEALEEIYQQLSPEARDAFMEGVAELGAQDLTTPGWQRALRDIAAIPESVFVDRDYARKRVGTLLAQAGLGDRARAEAYQQSRLERTLDLETAKRTPQALEDLEQALPGLDAHALYGAASELAYNRAQTDLGMLSANRRVSPYEDQLLRSPIGQSLDEPARQRMSQLIRELGPETFDQLFFFGDQRVPDQQAWQSMKQGLEVELPSRFKHGITYRNPQEEQRAAKSWERQQAQQAQQEQQAVDEHAQRMAELDARGRQVQQEHQARQGEISQVSQALATERQKTQDIYQQGHRDRLALLDQYNRGLMSPTGVRPTPRVDPGGVVPDNQATPGAPAGPVLATKPGEPRPIGEPNV